GLFGASTGGGAALMAAAERPGRVGAVVSRGGRPDLAEGARGRVRAPAVWVGGGEDDVVIDWNGQAVAEMEGEGRRGGVGGGEGSGFGWGRWRGWGRGWGGGGGSSG